VPGAIKQRENQPDKLKMCIDKMGSEIKGVQVLAENTDREIAIELPGKIFFPAWNSNPDFS